MTNVCKPAWTRSPFKHQTRTWTSKYSESLPKSTTTKLSNCYRFVKRTKRNPTTTIPVALVDPKVIVTWNIDSIKLRLEKNASELKAFIARVGLTLIHACLKRNSTNLSQVQPELLLLQECRILREDIPSIQHKLKAVAGKEYTFHWNLHPKTRYRCELLAYPYWKEPTVGMQWDSHLRAQTLGQRGRSLQGSSGRRGEA
jgi:hypothetical protein